MAKTKTYTKPLALLLAVAMIMLLLPSAIGAAAHWAENDVNALNDVIGAGTFIADDTPVTAAAANSLFAKLKTGYTANLTASGDATRLQTVQAIWALCGAALEPQLPGGTLPEFTDTSDNAVRSLAALGIVNGVGDGYFAPNAPMRGWELAIIAHRIFLIMGGAPHAKTLINGEVWRSEEMAEAAAAMNAVFASNTFAAADTTATVDAINTLFGTLKSGYSGGPTGSNGATRLQACQAVWALCSEFLTSQLPSGQLPTFTDTNDTAVSSLAALGIVNGVGDGTFAPNEAVSNGTFALITYRAFNMMGGPASAKSLFINSNDRWDTEKTEVAAELNAIFGANTFAADDNNLTVAAANTLFGKLKSGYNAGLTASDNATRLQACQAIWTMCSESLTSQLPDEPLPTFTDTSDTAVCSLAALGIVSGVGDGLFAPYDYLSNGALAVMIYRTLYKVGGGNIAIAHATINNLPWATSIVAALNTIFGTDAFTAGGNSVAIDAAKAMFTALKPSANIGMLVVTEDNAGDATRLQAAQAIWALCGASLTSQLPSGTLPEFTDTSDSAVRSLAALGIVNGTGNGVFSPDNSIKDTEIAAIIYDTFIKMGGVTQAKTILNPTYTPPAGGGTGGSSTPSPTPAAPVETAPVADSTVSVSYTQTENTVTVALPDEKVAEIIDKATDVAAIDLSGVADATAADVPVAALTKIADAGLAVEIDLPQGSVTLDADAVSSIAEQVGDANVSVALEPVETSSLNESQQTAVGDAPVFDISISSGDIHITSFDGARVTIALPYTLKAGESALYVVVIYVDASGAAERLPTSYDIGAEKVTFTTDHLSLYAIAYDESIAAPAAMPFTDVSASDWFYGDVEYAYANGLMNGTTASTFGPETPVTRAMLVTILYRLEGSPVAAGGAPFDDVADGQYYTDAVAWASGNGIVTGIGGDKFAPNGSITRQDMAVILARYAAFKGKALPAIREADAFADSDEIVGYAREAVTALNEAGLINGANGRVNPRGATPRSQAAALLHRYIEA